MHEESYGVVIRDYLTGEEIEETSYEAFRQALARMLVTERGYPRQRIEPKAGVCVAIDGRDYTRMVDFVVRDEAGAALLVVIFCSGEVGSYVRETLAASRLLAPAPAPLAVVTDTREALLLEVATGATLDTGGRAIPRYERLVEMAAAAPAPRADEEALSRERRILYAYSELLSGGCCQAACRPKARRDGDASGS